MNRFSRVWCLFEQSGTFKNVFMSKGFAAYDVDIADGAKSVDVKCNLFDALDKWWSERPCFFDSIEASDLVFAFFPCTYFSDQSLLVGRGDSANDKGLEKIQRYYKFLTVSARRQEYFEYLAKLCIVAHKMNFQLIIENPLGKNNILRKVFPKEHVVDILDRRKFGDVVKKPTQFLFVNCEENFHLQKCYEVREGTGKLRGKEMLARSMMSREFADSFIDCYVL